MWEVIKSTMPFLWKGLITTTELSLLAILFGSCLGFLVGVGRAIGPSWLKYLLGGYIHLLRGSPFLVQIYIVYFVLPTTGIAIFQLGSWSAAIIVLSIYTSTYIGEIVRGAIEAIPRGQFEAAKSSGMTGGQVMRYIILPQTIKMVLPPMGGIYVIVIKGTSVLSVIAVSELVRQGETSILRYPSHILLIYLLVAFMYGIYCYPVLRFTRWAENRWGA
jgi:polar amino acid transport system permease protein